MPGIVGIFSHKHTGECNRLVKSMVASMEHESFYVSGTYAAAELGVYGGWVAHEKSFAADQVFFNERKDIALLFSGECFVDRGRGQKEAAGNWLARLYEEDETKFFENLNGLFSGLLIDKRQGKAVLFNDRYGVERIYWHENNDAIYFASEAKALLRILPELRAFDEEGVAQFLTFGSPLEGRTLFRDVQLLPGGSVWSFANGTCQKRKYFSPASWEAQPILSAISFESQFQETFKGILPAYFQSESRTGISLTGGLDTRMIMAGRPDTAETAVCYTFSGASGQTLDDRLAKRVAEAGGLEHELLRIGPDFFSSFAAHADRTVYITDGSFGLTGAHEIYLNEQARQLATVRLTGNYGSEVLRGVSTFKPISLAPDLLHSEFDRAFSAKSKTVSYTPEHPVTFGAFREIPLNLFGSLAAARSQVTVRTPFLDNRIVALAYQAPENLRRSSLPAMNLIKENAPALYRIPTDMGEMGETGGVAARLRRFVSKITFKLDWLNNEGLPSSLSPLDPMFQRVASSFKIVGLHKYLHYRSWFREELSGHVRGMLSQKRVRESPFWNSRFVEQMSREHMEGRRNYVREINAVLTLEAVERLLFRELPSGIDLKKSEMESGRAERLLVG
jgi:asparagine synthase (glutamine-hydrolysing)